MHDRLPGPFQHVEHQSVFQHVDQPDVLRLLILQKPFKQLIETLEFKSPIINTLS